ncbi:ankyrin-2-like [Diorhabda carinulata]|uniref:ankyrin-2-like n=1 Tax=Diorhabda carinulata TaxID=1163345 RepID=UPI0025A18297|nr:ankyrin-2-like [Diorhabda carinulata]
MACHCCLLYGAIREDNQNLVLSLLKSVDINQLRCPDYSSDYSLLSAAILSNNLKMVEILLDHGSRADKLENDLYPIHLAVIVDSLDTFKLLLKYKADLHQKTETGSHSIHLAADYGRLEFLEYLLELEVDINLRDIEHCTPLYRAVAKKQIEAVEFLIKRGGDIEATDIIVNSRLNLSVELGFCEIWKNLLDTDAFTGKIKSNSAFYLAAGSGSIPFVEYFLNKGADVQFKTEDGYTLLDAAVRNNRPNLVVFLINKGADINSTTERNYSALDFAVQDILIQNLAKFEVKKCRLLQVILKRLTSCCSTYDLENEITSAKIIIIFLTLRNRLVPPFCPVNFPLSEELNEFWYECKRDLEEMDNYFINNTTISQYKLLQALFDDKQLAKYLYNEEISNLCRDFQSYIRLPQKFGDISTLIKNGVERVRSRKSLSDRKNKGMVCDCCLLYTAIEDDNEKLVLHLLKSVNINQKKCKDYSLLSWAIMMENIKMVRLLLDQGAIPENPDKEFYPIHHSVCIGALDIFKLLLEYGVDINQRTVFGSHSIHLAARYGRIEFLEYLFEEGVDTNLNDRCETTPLFSSIINGQIRAFRFLINHGANVNKIDRYGNSPLHFSVGFGFKTITDSLIRKGAVINRRNFSGLTPLHLAARYGPVEMLKLLYEAGAECKLTGKCRHYSPLHLAADSGNIEILDYFISKGADVNFQTEHGYSLLHAAVRNNHPKLALYLIDHGADVNATTTNKNYSVLDFAARSANPCTINILIQNLAKFDVKSNGNCRLLELLPTALYQYDSVSDIKKYKTAAEIIIKFITLRNRNLPVSFPKNSHFIEELSEFWRQCKQDLEEMDNYYLGDTSISQYKLLNALFDDTRLSKYLYNEEISALCRDIEAYIKVFPKYGNIKRLIKMGMYKGKIRHILSNSVYCVVKEKSFLSVLPLEIIMKICDYLDIKDLITFVSSATMRVVQK